MGLSEGMGLMMGGRTVRVFAPAKINWVLTIERRREDGFHDIHTVFQTLAWGDELVCRPLAEPACRILCNDPAVPIGPENLVAKAWRRLREDYPRQVEGLQIELIKRIPTGAGLGGGSSDGVAALAAVNALYGLRLRRAELERQAAALGSDCAFFVRGGTALGAGRGERLTPLKNHLPPLWLVVVFPGFHSPTAEAYRAVGPEHWENGQAGSRAGAAIERGDLAALQQAGRNVFHDLLQASDPRYQTLARQLEEEGLTHPLLSGSGSAMFALTRDPSRARKACRRLSRDYPVVVRTGLRRSGVGVLGQ